MMITGATPMTDGRFIIPLTIDISTISPSYKGYVHQLSYRPGAPPCMENFIIIRDPRHRPQRRAPCPPSRVMARNRWTSQHPAPRWR